MSFFWIGLGGFLGANARFLVQDWAARRWGVSFPYGTMIANVTGSFLLALLVGLVAGRFNFSRDVELLLGAGFLGSYTTFSSFAYETWALFDVSGWWRAALNLCGNVVLGVAATLLGLGLAALIV